MPKRGRILTAKELGDLNDCLEIFRSNLFVLEDITDHQIRTEFHDLLQRLELD